MDIKLEYDQSKADLTGMIHDLEHAFSRVLRKRNQGYLGFMELIKHQEDIGRVKEKAGWIRDRFENFVLIGIGGSNLGGLALQEALNGKYYNEKPKSVRKGPRFYMLDNPDPESVGDLLDMLEPEHTVFNVISKSGGTAETMSNFMIVYDWLSKSLPEKAVAERIIATTDRENSILLDISREKGFDTFYIPNNVGGRFSVLSPVGLLSASTCGIDIDGLLRGAAAMSDRCSNFYPEDNPALMDAAVHYAMMKTGRNISVMMPYADRLKYMSDWYAQLWAESLGKKKDNDEKTVNTGQTPVKALGTIDQHSQVQLYAEGPDDKIITFLRVERFRREMAIPGQFSNYDNLSVLAGRGLSELMNAEQSATSDALSEFGRPVLTVVFPEINEETVGQFIYMQELKTAYCGELLNINAFNQPGVELGKVLTRKYMTETYEKGNSEK